MVSYHRPSGRGIGLVGSGAAAAWFLVWESVHRGSYAYNVSIYPFSDADEWRYTACGRLVEHGYALFDQVYSAQPPVLFLSLAASMHLFGDSIDGARIGMIALGLLGLVATIWLTWLIAGPVAAAAAGILLSLSPGFLIYSHAVEAEGPMMAFVTLAMAAAATYRRYGRPALPLVSGLALATAILIKLFALEALVPALWLLRSSAGRVPTIILFMTAVLVPVVGEFALVAPHAQWQQVVALHQSAAATFPGAPSTASVLDTFLSLDPGLSLLAAGALVGLIVLRKWEDLLFLLFWCGGQLVMLTLFHPLFPHHPVILLPSLATSAGIGIAIWIEQLRSSRWLIAAPLTLAVVLWAALVPRVAHNDRHSLLPALPSGDVQLAHFVRSRSRPGDFIATDDLMVADLAHRFVPPGLCDPSLVRMYAGDLPARELIRQTAQYHAVIVLPAFVVYQHMRGYMQWVREHYRPVSAPDGVTAYVSDQKSKSAQYQPTAHQLTRSESDRQ